MAGLGPAIHEKRGLLPTNVAKNMRYRFAN